MTDQLLFYTTPQHQIKIDVRLQDETLWLPQKQMAELFGVNVPAISKHLKNIFESGELEENSVISILENTITHIWSFGCARTGSGAPISTKWSKRN